MKRINFSVMLILSLIVSNLAYSQTIKAVYTIGSNYTPGGSPNCYSKTPSLILPPLDATSNNISPQTNTTNSFVFNDPSDANKINDVIKNAYGKGYKHFYFQEGLYVIDTPIDLSNLNGITIEGGGAGTVFKPANTTLTTIFDVKNCYNGKIKNLGIDLKTTLTCGDGQNTSDINTGIKIGAQVGRCLFENIFFRSNISANATVKGTSPILVQLTAGQESDYNTFNNIQFQRSRGGIVLDITGSDNPDDLASNGVFNHNTFSNIHLEHCLVGVDFIGSGGTIEGNLFSNFDVQASKDTDGALRLRTTDIVRNIRGVNNTFQNFNIADFNACASASSPGCSAVGYVFSVTNKAERTVIENTETEGNFVTGSDAKNGWYIDGGIGTQFINNASTNRLTDYIKRNLSDVIFIGQNSPNPVANTGTSTNFDAATPNAAYKNYFRVEDFGSVYYKGRTQNLKKTNGVISQDTYLGSVFITEDYSSYSFGNFRGGTNPFTATGSLFTIKGRGQFQPHASGIYNFLNNNNPYITANLNPTLVYNGTTYNIPLSVLTNADNNGALQWTKVSDISWNHIATKNIKLDGFAITNNSNATPATNTDAGLRLDNAGNVRIGTAAPFT
ncbi:hypothetical protein, partial [Flavobacterium branchiophilum]